jgi:WD40 repeat protein
MTAIFISHSSADNAAAAEMKAWLEAQGHTSLFLDFDPETGIKGGGGWEQTLYQKLRQCQAVIALLTPNWLASKWCFAELVQARERGKAIFPVKMQACEAGDVFGDIQRIDFTAHPEEGYKRLRIGLLERGLDPLDVFDWDPKRPPYPGLMSFQEQDAAIFFGRGEEILKTLETLEALRRQGGEAARFVLLLGASGSGKSSLARAGVIPRLNKQPAAWLPISPFRPQEDPLEELAVALSAAFNKYGASRTWDELRSGLHTAARQDPVDGRVLPSLVRDLTIAAKRPEATVLLTIDQTEELFGYSPPEAAERFLRLLRAALETADRRLITLATMRSDFLGEFQNHAVLHDHTGEYAHHFRYQAVPVDPMPLRNFPQIIEGPARLGGLELEDGLVEAMVRDTGTRDALPLLAFTLRRLYERHGQDARLQIRQYEALGGLEGSIREEANRLLEAAQPSPEQLEALHAAFVPAMVRINAEGGYARRRAPLLEIPPRAVPLLRRFVDARLLVTDRDTEGREIIEVAHEALLRTWPRLTTWLADDQDKLRLLESLQRAAEEWDKSGRRSDLLVHRDSRLRDAVTLLADPRFAVADASVERAYLEAASAAQLAREAAEKEEQERRIRDAERIAGEQKKAAAAQIKITQRTRIGLGAALILLAVAGWQWWSTKNETISALIESADARFAANQGWDALTTSLHAARELRTTLLGRVVEYFDQDRRSQISQSLQQALYGIREYKRLKYEIKGYVHRLSSIGQLEWSSNGKNLAFISGNNEATVWIPDSNSLRTIRPNFNTESNDQVGSVNWRPLNDDELTISSKNGAIEFLDQQGTQISPSISPINNVYLYGISWRPDGQELAFATFNHGLAISKPDGTRLQMLKQDGTWFDRALPADFNDQTWSQVWSVSWSHEPQHLLAAGSLMSTVRWGNPDDGSLACKASGSWPWSMSWSPDGKSLAVGFGDNTVRLLPADCKPGQPEHVLSDHTAPVTGLSWSSDWRLATASEQDRTVRLWNKEGRPLDTFHVPTVRGGVQWRPDGQVLATLDQYGLVRLWKDNPLVKTFTAPARAKIQGAALSPDGLILASASGNGIAVWRQDRDNRWPSEPEFLPNGDANSTSVSWSPDGQLLASTSYNAVTIWDRSGSIIWHSDGTKKPLPHGGGFYKPLGNGVLTVIWSPDGKEIATGDGNLDVTIWDAETGSILSQTSYCKDWAEILAWNPVNNRSLAVGCHNNGGALLQWNLDTKNLEGTRLVDHGKPIVEGINGVSWSNDGKILATGGGDNRINLWTRDGTLMLSVDAGGEVGQVAWSPDGSMLAVASGNNMKLLARDGHPITVLKGHSRVVTSVMWNKQTLVSASYDGTVRLWQIDKGLVEDPLGTLLVHSCNWLRAYLDENPLISKEDADLQGLCR